ncbi:MAG: translation initiation factor IF-3 [candidate division Zixibacteria bacterium]|nr:translation initiation factor IF-3 [candidate division Zixibacteria bacterium]MDD5425912.1 translation initiation factor IF-3 [candidate division Zixibacteria bacterium]
MGPDGDQLGIIPTNEALKRAAEYGLDLVEVSPNSRPPVCRIMDFGKFKYELSKKDKLAKKKQHTFQMKEMRYRPKTEEHDYQFKTKHVREFVESGNKVKIFVIFRGREMAHVEYGQKILDRVKGDLADIAMVDSEDKLEGRNLSMILSPKPEVLKKVQAEKSAKKKKPEKSVKTDKRETAEPDVISESEKQVDSNI